MSALMSVTKCILNDLPWILNWQGYCILRHNCTNNSMNLLNIIDNRYGYNLTVWIYYISRFLLTSNCSQSAYMTNKHVRVYAICKKNGNWNCGTFVSKFNHFYIVWLSFLIQISHFALLVFFCITFYFKYIYEYEL
jgi:hypothetical protein